MTTTTDPEQKILDSIKTALRIPLDLTADDNLLTTYILAAEQYVEMALDSEVSHDNETYQFLVSYMSQYFYLNRDNPATKEFPIQFSALLNQLRYSTPKMV